MSLRPRTDLSVSDDTAHVARAIFHEENLVMQMRDLLPATHIADTGFVNAPLLAEAREGYNIDLIGPTRGDNQWQLKEGAGFAARDFDIDWDRNHAVCPEGKISSSWTPAVDRRKNEVIEFSGGLWRLPQPRALHAVDRLRGGRSPSGIASSTRRSKRGDNESGQPSTPPSTRGGPGSSGPSRRGPTRMGFGGRATSGSPRRTSST